MHADATTRCFVLLLHMPQQLTGSHAHAAVHAYLKALTVHTVWSYPSSGPQAEDFFAPLPQAIISCLRGAPCIATENSTWVLPAEAVISVEGTAAARGLLAQAISFGIPSVNYVHPAMAALHSSSALRSALGIKLLDTDHLLHLLQTASAQGMFARLGAQWVANMLACIFDMLADKEPHIRSLRAQDITLSSAAQALLQQLKLLPMFPTSTDQWIAAGEA